MSVSPLHYGSRSVFVLYAHRDCEEVCHVGERLARNGYLRARSEKNAARETSAKINNEVSRDNVRPRGCSVKFVSRDCGRIRPRSPPPKVRSRENLQILVFLETEVSKM